MKKDEFTLWLGICAIIGLFIWQMPNIERLIFGRAKTEKTETVKEETKEETIISSGRVTCGASLSDESNIEYILTYEDNKVKKVLVTVNTLYASKDSEYQSAVTECNGVAAKYANQTGLTATCTVSDLTISNKQQFDLQSFRTATIENEDGSVETITMDIEYNEDIEDAVKTIKDIGATCK